MKDEFKGEYRKLGIRVTYFRKQKGLSQQNVADLLNTESAYVSKVERGDVGLTLDSLCKIARALGVPAYSLLDFRDMQD